MSKKNQRLSVFEEIDERITTIEKSRAENEAGLKWEIESLKIMIRDQNFDNDAKKK